jgi:beta-glucosidase-like glycosyl hydrolase
MRGISHRGNYFARTEPPYLHSKIAEAFMRGLQTPQMTECIEHSTGNMMNHANKINCDGLPKMSSQNQP